MPHIVVVGGGIAGLACAEVLAPHVKVTMVDAGRRVGGRLGAIEPFDCRYSFDHGAQYLSHDGGAFGEFLEDCEKAGAVAKWAPITSLGKISNDEEGILIMDSLVRNSTSKTVYVGTPCMASAPGHLLARMKDSLEELWENTTCTGLTRKADSAKWQLELRVRDGGHYWYKLLDADLVITALGHAQTNTLLRLVAPKFVAPAAEVTSNVCWVLMAAFEDPLGLAFNGVLLEVWQWMLFLRYRWTSCFWVFQRSYFMREQLK